jgi:hypothetical protein
VAQTQIEALEKSARLAIERTSVDTQTTVMAGGFTSVEAATVLDGLPSVEQLMPVLDVKKIELLLIKPGLAPDDDDVEEFDA